MDSIAKLCSGVWRPVKGYEEFYEVSADGRVRSLGGWHRISGKMLSQSTDKRSYRRVELFINRKGSNKQVHRLVAEQFIPNPKGLPHVNHIDGNPSNNVYTNLEWCDHQGNMDHAWRTGLINNSGELHGMHKLTETQARAIKAHQDKTFGQAGVIGPAFGVSEATVRDIWAGRSWRHI